MKGFRKFLMQGNVIDLAVAVVIGVAFNAIVQALVKDMITPLISAIVGNKKSFESWSFPAHGSLHGATFTYGAVINAALSFFVIALVIYYLVVAPNARLTALANRNKAATDRQCPECVSTIPINAKRCMYCTSEVPPVPIPDAPAPRLRRPGQRRRHGAVPSD
jgi:large conductance mechanosensitive channel